MFHLYCVIFMKEEASFNDHIYDRNQCSKTFSNFTENYIDIIFEFYVCKKYLKNKKTKDRRGN